MALWSAFSHLRGTEAIPPVVPMEQPLNFSEVSVKCGLVTQLLSRLQEPSCTSYSGFAKFMHQVCTRFAQDHGSKMASRNPDHLVEYSKAHGNVILLPILNSLLLALFIAVRASNMKSHHG